MKLAITYHNNRYSLIFKEWYAILTMGSCLDYPEMLEDIEL